MIYYYFVSYVVPQDSGFGYSQIISPKEITDIEDLVAIAQELGKTLDKRVTILYYSLLRKEK